MPLIYPYEPWRFKHDRHHAKTNMLREDTAWHPVWKDEFESTTLLRKAIIYGYGPFRCWMSIAHWLMWHFDLKKFRPSEWPLIIYKTGWNHGMDKILVDAMVGLSLLDEYIYHGTSHCTAYTIQKLRRVECCTSTA
ncbi:hypothetical protein JHK82_046850 [Glycine max]|nr:hypothetical protein JHK82_046850 [Glycine max]